MKVLLVTALVGMLSLLASVAAFAVSLRYLSSVPAIPIVSGIAVLSTAVVVVLIANTNARIRISKRAK
jgi:hypothetical protein